MEQPRCLVLVGRHRGSERNGVAVTYRNPRAGIRDKWLGCVLVAQIDGETRALLLLLYHYMTERGRVSVPQAVLADLFQVDPRRIKERMRRARDAGLIAQRGVAYQGRTAEYEAVVPSAMRWSPATPSE